MGGGLSALLGDTARLLPFGEARVMGVLGSGGVWRVAYGADFGMVGLRADGEGLTCSPAMAQVGFLLPAFPWVPFGLLEVGGMRVQREEGDVEWGPIGGASLGGLWLADGWGVGGFLGADYIKVPGSAGEVEGVWLRAGGGIALRF